MARAEDWKQLRDGAALHASHLFQIAEHGESAAAAVALAAGLSGRFVGALNPQHEVNVIGTDDDSRTVDIEGIHVITAGGFLASLPGGKKSFVLPTDEKLRFLNLYVRDFKTTAVWEASDATGPRGICLVERTDRGFQIKPKPADLRSLGRVAVAFGALRASAATLRQTLIDIDAQGLSELRLAAQDAHHLGGLFGALEQVLYLADDAPLSAALPMFRRLAEQCRGWASFIAASSGAGQGSAALPDDLGRARLSQRGNLPLPDYFAPLEGAPGDGTGHIVYVEALARTVIGLNRTICGERDEDAIKPIETFDPDLFPGDGLGLRYALPDATELTFRCDLSSPTEPQLYWGMAPAGAMPNLRALALDSTAAGRFEAFLGPVSPGPADQLVLILDDSQVALRVFLPR
jgi:hypothetical protein